MYCRPCIQDPNLFRIVSTGTMARVSEVSASIYALFKYHERTLPAMTAASLIVTRRSNHQSNSDRTTSSCCLTSWRRSFSPTTTMIMIVIISTTTLSSHVKTATNGRRIMVKSKQHLLMTKINEILCGDQMMTPSMLPNIQLVIMQDLINK